MNGIINKKEGRSARKFFDKIPEHPLDTCYLPGAVANLLHDLFYEILQFYKKQRQDSEITQ